MHDYSDYDESILGYGKKKKKSNKYNFQFLRDPLALCRVLWPNDHLYKQEREMFYSVWHHKLTICVAGNMMGKDYTAARIALCFFLTRSPCRILTTSVDWTQLQGVLWGEMLDAIQRSTIPLKAEKGGPLLVNDLRIRKVFTSGPMKGQLDPLSYLLGKQAKKGEAMLGHHIKERGIGEDGTGKSDGIPRTLFIGDEASSLDDDVINKAETWADRMFIFGNPYPCSNRFFHESEAGNLPSGRMVKKWEGVTLEGGHTDKKQMVEHMTRNVIRIRCKDSPNVRLAEAEVAAGREPSEDIIVPGVMSYWKYLERRKTWDIIKQTIQLDAEFYKGAELLLFPPEWLNKSEAMEYFLRGRHRIPRSIGCDPGEGQAETVWYVVDEYGIIDELAKPTPDTSVIVGDTLYLMRKWNIVPEMVMFDRGGGGKQITDEMKRLGYNVKTVGFGESVVPPPKRGMTSIERQIEAREEKYAYVDRRAEMYGRLSNYLEPIYDVNEDAPIQDYKRSIEGIAEIILDGRDGKPRFCIPAKYVELRRQLAPIPKWTDREGRMRLPSKKKSDGVDSKEKTLTEICGCSPDRADALVIAVYARDFATKKFKIGAA